jgi:hypothetical protein
MLVGYVSGATDGYDNGYDAKSMDANQYADFYSINNNMNLSIQGRALPFHNDDMVLLGYRSEINGTLKISIGLADGELESEDVYLLDKTLGIYHTLKEGAYSFNTVEGVFDNRFEMYYSKPSNTYLNIQKSGSGNSVIIYKNLKNEIIIDAKDMIISEVKIFDTQGKLLFGKKGVNATQTSINAGFPDEMLLIQVISQDGKTLTKKFLHKNISMKLDKMNEFPKTQLAEDE